MELIGKNEDKKYKINLYEDGSSCLILSDGSVANPKVKIPTKNVDNFIFKDTLKLIGSVQKSSTISFIFESTSNGAIYNMFHSNLVQTLQTKTMENGIISGNWTFIKKGPGIGLILS